VALSCPRFDGAGARGVLVHPHDAGIGLGVPVQVTGGVGVGLHPLFDPGPGPVLFPPREPVVAGLAWSVTFRNLVPLRAVLDPPQDPIDHLPVIAPPATTLRLHAGQQRLQSSPLVIAEIASHDTINDRSP
jgi:hypothetical protein